MHIKRIIILTLTLISLSALAGCFPTTTTTLTVPTTIIETKTLPVLTKTITNTETITSSFTTTTTSPVTTTLPPVTSTTVKTTTLIVNNTETVTRTITHIITVTVTTTEYPSPCLCMGTLIDTPNGQVPVEQLQEGMIVWSVDESGNRVASALSKTSQIPVPPTHQVAVVTLADGRTVTASLDHPTAEGKALGDYRVGDILDGSQVVSAEHMSYSGGATYDILPDSTTGFYWANGILLASTLK